MWLNIIIGVFFVLGLILLVGGIYLLYSLYKIVQVEGFWLPGVVFFGYLGVFGVLLGVGLIAHSI